MTSESLIRQLLGTFLEETEDHLAALERGLLALESGAADRAEQGAGLFRAAHSLKGAARAVGAAEIEALCHRLEETFAADRDGRAPLSPEAAGALLPALDGIREATARFRRRYEAHAAPASPAPAAAPPAPRPRAQRESERAPRQEAGPPPPEPAERAPDDAPLIRVSSRKLDDLQVLSDELLAVRRRAAHRRAELGAAAELLADWQRDWRPLEEWLAPQLRKRLRPRARPGEGEAAVPARALAEVGRIGPRLRRLASELERLESALEEDARVLEQTSRPLDATIQRMRMVPLGDLTAGLAREVRDLARATGRLARLSVEGAEIELDRAVIDGLRDPLRHLVRNAVAHGIEPPAEREAAGKPAEGAIVIAARRRGAQVEVRVRDDGRGIDGEALARAAAAQGLAAPADPQQRLRLALLAGISTAGAVDAVAGRGVGLDVVAEAARALRGSVDVRSQPGQGTTIALRVPLMRSRLMGLVLRAAGDPWVLPTESIGALHRIAPEDLGRVEGQPVLRTGGAPVPVVPLADLLGLASPPGDAAHKLILVEIHQPAGAVALAVDELLEEQDTRVIGLGPRLEGMTGLLGATLLPTGQLAPILDPADLASRALARPAAPALEPQEAAAPAKRLLIAEDSVTTRSLMRSILEASGYQVRVAADGAEAWQLLQQERFDAVVSDIEMPRMDGFALTAAIRAARALRELPIILVTALESEPDRRRGMEAGADAYLAKSAFDQQALLETLARFL